MLLTFKNILFIFSVSNTKGIKMENFKPTAAYAPGNFASKEAANNINHKLSGIRALVFEYIASKEHGATGSEIAEALDILLYTAKPRCTELRDAGYIKNSGFVRDNPNGQKETVWILKKDYPQELVSFCDKSSPKKSQDDENSEDRWFFRVSDYENQPVVHFGVNGGGVALHPDTPDALKKAKLIAAAPDLLEALERIYTSCPSRKIGDICEKAIAKVKGRQ